MELNIIEPKDAEDLKAKLKKISEGLKEKLKKMSEETQTVEDFDIVVENNILTLDRRWLLKRQDDKHLSNIQQYIGNLDDAKKMKEFRIEESNVVKEHTGKENAGKSAFLYARLETVKGERPRIILSYIDLLQDIQQEDIGQWKKDGLELYDLGKINREQLTQSTNYTYGVMQRENDRMNILLNKPRLNQKYFQKYFFYGLENRDAVLEGIIQRVCRDLNNSYTRVETGDQIPSTEEKIEEVRKRTIEIYQQLYRFVNVIEEDDRRFDFRLSLGEKQTIKNKVNNAISALLEQERLLIFKRTICLRDKPDEYSKEKDIPLYNKGEHIWTDEVYEVLKQLETMKKTDLREYYRNWLEAKLSRLERKGYSDKALSELREIYTNPLERKRRIGQEI